MQLTPITGYFAKKSRTGKLKLSIRHGNRYQFSNLKLLILIEGPENSQTTASPSTSDSTCDASSNVEDSPMEHSEYGHITDSKWRLQIEITVNFNTCTNKIL